MCVTETVLDCSPTANSLTCSTAQTTTHRKYSPHSTTPLRNAAATQRRPPPSSLPNLHAHMQNTTQLRQRQRLLQRHPREHHPFHNNADATNTRLRATRQTPADEARVRKHENAHPASERAFAKAGQPRRQHTQARRRRTPNPSRQSGNHQSNRAMTTPAS